MVSDACPGNLLGPLGLKFTKVFSMAEPSRVHISQASLISLSSNESFTSSSRSDPSKWWSSVSLFTLKVVVCPMTSILWLRKVVDFQFVQLFFHCEVGNDDFQALYVWGWKPEVQMSIGTISWFWRQSHISVLELQYCSHCPLVSIEPLTFG